MHRVWVAVFGLALLLGGGCSEDRPPRIPGSLGTIVPTGTTPAPRPRDASVDADATPATDSTSDALVEAAPALDSTSDAIADAAPDSPLTPCLTRCDCPQGLACTLSQCTFTATPTYCCENAGCVTGQPCQTANGEQRTCQ